MNTTIEKIEELILETAEKSNNAIYIEILDLLATLPTPIPQAVKDGISMIIDAWQLEPTESKDRTNFLIEVAKYCKQDFADLRSSLPAIIKKTLPKGFNKTTSIKALGIRDTSIPLCNVYSRYRKLITLADERFYFSTISNSWGSTKEIDWIAGIIELTSFHEKETNEIDLGVALKQTFFFAETEDLKQLIFDKKIVSYSKAVETIKSNTPTNIPDETLRNILFYTYIPERMTPHEFEQWKTGKNDADEVGTIENARSVQELNQILITNKDIKKISDNELSKIKEILNIIKPSSATTDFFLWTETVCILIKKLSIEQVKELIPNNKEVLHVLWPDGSDLSSAGVKIWTDLKIVTLNVWADFTRLVKGEDYLIDLCSFLPWKAWPTIISKVDKEEVINILDSSKRLNSPEALLWIWKNKASLPKTLLEKINTVNLFSAIGRKKDGAIWNTALRELKKLIIENQDFQMSLIKDKNNESEIIDFLERLNPLTSLTKNEKQSIIVKLSRKFPAMKDLFNTGKAKKVLTTQVKEDDEETSAAEEEQHITSKKSYTAKLAELEEIINTHMPENTKDIATAREHGDLRENAEYAAAKERQKYLSEHRAMLEYGIMTTVPTVFAETVINDTIIAGCTVTLSFVNSKEETYHILGAWDSNPAKKYISYDTGMGKVLVGKKVNDKVTLPDGNNCIIAKIEKLTQKILKDLD